MVCQNLYINEKLPTICCDWIGCRNKEVPAAKADISIKDRPFPPDVVIEVVLHACHSYKIEAYKIMNHAKSKHNLPYLKIETDYSDGDIEQIRTRVEALFDSL